MIWSKSLSRNKSCCHGYKSVHPEMSRKMKKQQQNDLCVQRRLRSAWASAKSNLSLRCPPEETLSSELPINCTAKTLIRLSRCPGWPESSLGTQVIMLVLSCCSSNVLAVSMATLARAQQYQQTNMCIWGRLGLCMTKPTKWCVPSKDSASAKSDLSPNCAVYGKPRAQRFFMRRANLNGTQLILLVLSSDGSIQISLYICVVCLMFCLHSGLWLPMEHPQTLVRLYGCIGQANPSCCQAPIFVPLSRSPTTSPREIR